MEDLLFMISGKNLYAEVLEIDNEIFVEVRDDLDESLIERIPVKSKEEAMTIAYNATVGKET